MSSMAEYAIEMGMDPTVGPDGREWSESIYRRPDANREIFGDDSDEDRVGYDTPSGRSDSRYFRSRNTTNQRENQEWFATAGEAFDLAKRKPGSIAKRAPDGNGFIVIIK